MPFVRGTGMRVWIVPLKICTRPRVLLAHLLLRLVILVANGHGELHEHCRRRFSLVTSILACEDKNHRGITYLAAAA